MTPISVIALFCEDIREETGSRITLLGTMPDNIEGVVDPNMPTDGTPVIPKLCIYTRLQFDPNEEISVVKSRLIFPNGETRDTNLFPVDVVQKARDEAREMGAPTTGVISRVIIPNFPVLADGRLVVEVSIGETTYVAGALNMKIIRAASASIS